MHQSRDPTFPTLPWLRTTCNIDNPPLPTIPTPTTTTTTITNTTVVAAEMPLMTMPFRTLVRRLPRQGGGGALSMSMRFCGGGSSSSSSSTLRRCYAIGGGNAGLGGSSMYIKGALSLHSSRFHSSTSTPTPTPTPTPLPPVQKQKKKLSKILPALTPHENIYNLPNILTFSRLLASPVIGYLVLHDQPAAALGLFAAAGLTDLVDGWIARRWKLQTVVGSVIDPMADKVLMTVLTVTLAMQGLLPVWIAAVILGRDVGLAISAIYFRWISLPPPKTMVRYWDFSLPSAEVHPTTISKLNTALQLGLVGACMAHPLVGAGAGAADLEIALQALQYTVATTTVWSGLSYVYSKDAVKILKQPGVGAVEEKKEEGKL
ncbi:uncharacterized protein H6S33_001750 [Morchella sextelata]|uniref:uncharacterized protein n=1 Tax=Morchella sextelata TaxID=1174677 RepID=UPI001D055781|nr:uncharacterized protein H6S33_001750 [Morchella sextelata]KAH0608616.1 hypothetical protein H6S33_001750 [Morchella sextelata]